MANAHKTEQTVLVTGANSGIGLATVLEVARRGFRAVGSVRSEDKAIMVRSAASGAGLAVETVLLDVTDTARCQEVIGELRPWGLVNNAGYGGPGAVEDVGDDEARQLLETMVIAPMRLCRLALPHMREARSGRIVNMSSVMGVATAPLVGWYSGAKHALEALTDALRVEVASAGVAVVLVEPGGFRTGIWEETREAVDFRQGSSYRRAYERTAFGIRVTEPLMGNPTQVARVVGRALTARRPWERYLVGIDAYALTLTQRLTPTSVRDVVTRFGLGL